MKIDHYTVESRWNEKKKVNEPSICLTDEGLAWHGFITGQKYYVTISHCRILLEL